MRSCFFPRLVCTCMVAHLPGCRAGDKKEVKYKTDTKTEIVYVPKYIYQDGSTEKTDIDINVGKQELAVKVNGKDFGIKRLIMKSMFLINISYS